MKEGQTRAKSVVLVHTGDGKGKSSSAWGVMIRGVARGWNVAVVQSIKSGQWNTGEEKIGRQLGVEWWTIGEGFSWESEDLTKDQAVAKEAWKQARSLIAAGQHDLVILDEITYPMNWGWIDTDDVVATVRDRPEHVHVVITGRNAPEAIVEIADTVTEMRMVKHAYERGIVAKKGIEY
ncbi:MAG TPA: cob(I)yrinic acid a,c-diamide adenosyltransferase [Acidimicrobiales bacterium]|nr:cob(I)yrinic acid a,c-diamide adenosyltransferase [Acidimicrobiales bacterium]